MNRPIPVIQQAMAAGFTHVMTFAGPIPLEQWTRRDELGLTFSDGAIHGLWRSPTPNELDMAQRQGLDPKVWTCARDRFECVALQEA